MTVAGLVADRVLALIPAKGGSTRLAQKNIRRLAGRTLVEWAADAVRGSGVATRIVVSTESQDVAEAARSAGIEVPFLRPEHLARDPAGVVDVALHALSALEEQGETFSTLIITLPTCPFRTAEDIRGAYEMFVARGRAFILSVAGYPHTPFAAMRLDDDGTLSPWFPQYFGRKSQELPKAYRPNGGVHVLDVTKFRVARTYFGTPLIAYEMPRERSLDVDCEADLREAEAYLANQGWA